MPAATLTRFVEDLGQSTVLSAEQRTQLPELQERYPDAHAPPMKCCAAAG